MLYIYCILVIYINKLKYVGDKENTIDYVLHRIGC